MLKGLQLSQTKEGVLLAWALFNEEIVGLYNNKIFGVDSSIKLGKYGELLFVINDRFYRGKLDGQLSEISK